jgi:hypothetical protein
MYRTTVSTTKTRRDAALTAQRLADGTPTSIDLTVAKMTADMRWASRSTNDGKSIGNNGA